MARHYTYNPFGKKVSELEESDLLGLKEVHEGWYVDYKARSIKARGYAKAISAMANTYGGWIFVGIQEASRNKNVAGSYPGLTSDQIDPTCQRIRQSVSEHLNPQPFFELRIVDAPDAENNEKVICVFVQASSKAPIIHSDGRIYRRLNDSSEPVPENNRESVEHLFQRSKVLKEWYSDWYDKDPELSKAEDNVSYLRILAVPDYWNDEQLWYEGSTEDFRKLLNSRGKGISFSFDYNNIYTNSRGFVCRAVNAPDARQITPTLIVNRDLQNEFWLPIPSFNLDAYPNYDDRSAELDELVNYLLERGYKNCTALDLTAVFGVVDAFFTVQRKLQQHLGYEGVTHVKFKLMNVWQRIPLMTASTTDLCWDKYGVPMILTDEVASSRGGAIENFEQISLHQELEAKSTSLILQSAPFFLKLLNSVGLGAGNFDNLHERFTIAVMASLQKANK